MLASLIYVVTSGAPPVAVHRLASGERVAHVQSERRRLKVPGEQRWLTVTPEDRRRRSS